VGRYRLPKKNLGPLRCRGTDKQKSKEGLKKGSNLRSVRKGKIQLTQEKTQGRLPKERGLKKATRSGRGLRSSRGPDQKGERQRRVGDAREVTTGIRDRKRTVTADSRGAGVPHFEG